MLGTVALTCDINSVLMPLKGDLHQSMFHINSVRIATLAAIVLFSSACTPNSSTPLPPAATEPDVLQAPTSGPEPAQPLLKTEQGDFVIAAARLVDEANGVKPQAGHPDPV
jgi:hypothetical protein